MNVPLNSRIRKYLHFSHACIIADCVFIVWPWEIVFYFLSIVYLRGLTADAAALRDRERMESRKVHDENPIGARMVKGVEPEMHPNGAPGKLARLRVWSQNGAPGKFARLMVWS